ncbi:hypothetical protein B4109_1486 [Geobacillus stearothermophilus]|uniref:Uncharacterized protein n=1 Tax=Geobacillus stearothermophilus TaxID=1422 RepID=A0A150MYI7_GEOSE|nr:hypothetical protein B4109_1486 [Geobacillus stearothermophilus]KYD32091.1 hypothetical protein B4114_1468 [Geobacillus stearothermophilus]
MSTLLAGNDGGGLGRESNRMALRLWAAAFFLWRPMVI